MMICIYDTNNDNDDDDYDDDDDVTCCKGYQYTIRFDLSKQINQTTSSVNTTDNVYPFYAAFERQSLRATASVQTSLGVPVIIHPGRDHASPAEIVRILQEAGGDVSRTVMSHLDRRWHFNPHAEFISRYVYIYI